MQKIYKEEICSLMGASKHMGSHVRPFRYFVQSFGYTFLFNLPFGIKYLHIRSHNLTLSNEEVPGLIWQDTSQKYLKPLIFAQLSMHMMDGGFKGEANKPL